MDKAFILYHKPDFELETAGQTLVDRGLTVTSNDDSLLVQWGDGPLLTLRHIGGPVATEQIKKLAKGKYAAELRNLDALFQVTFDSLDEVLDEINTLIEVQATLQDATHGYLYNTWNRNISPPEN